jgi:peptidoglycan/xylan/chitin deacetylase (PgdA/CDA1 family)
VKRILFALFYYSGLTRFAAWWHRRRVVFLCYHGVTERPERSSADAKGLHVNHRRFATHLDYLERHYNVISLSEFLSAQRSGRRLADYSVVLTFDDGFRNFLTTAAPMLASRRMPATAFLITDYAKAGSADLAGVSQKWTSEDDSTYLSWAEAQLLQKEGFEFGSHTCSHARLLGLPPAESERELLHSLNDLIGKLGVGTAALSYPKGEYSSLLATEARKVGYACAVTTDRGPNEPDHDPFTLGRTLIGDYDDRISFIVRVSGLRWWLAFLRELIFGAPLVVAPPVAVPVPLVTDDVPMLIEEHSAPTRP